MGTETAERRRLNDRRRTDRRSAAADQEAMAWGYLRRSAVALARLGFSFRDLVVAMEAALRNEEARQGRGGR